MGSSHDGLLNEAELAAAGEEKETHSFEIDPAQVECYILCRSFWLCSLSRCFFFLIRKKTIYNTKILIKERVQASTLQRGYLRPRWNLSTKSITSKEDWQNFALSQKKDNNILDSLKRCLVSLEDSFISKTLLFLSLQRIQKITCGIDKVHFS